MKSRERGSEGGVCNFNTLLGRWFNSKGMKSESVVGTIDKESTHEPCIKRGSVVKLLGKPNDFYLVFAGMKKAGNNKWWNSPDDDVLPWPIPNKLLKKETSSYRILLRKLEVKTNRNNDDCEKINLDYVKYNTEGGNGGVCDGVNLHSTYVMEKNLRNVSALCHQINI